MKTVIILTFLFLHILNVFGVRISQEKCDGYENMFPSIHSILDESSNDDTSEEVEDKVAPQEYPFMAKLYSGKSNRYYNGILISENFVLSNSLTLLLGEYSYAVFGDYVNETDVQPQQLKIIEIIKHPDQELYLFKLNSSVTFNKYVRPVCLSQPESVFSQQYTEIGWGVKNMLRREKLNFISNSMCDESYRQYYVDGQRFCASMEQGHASCNILEIINVHDLYAFGSALLNRREKSSYNEIVGIKTLSKGISCQSVPEDFVRVPTYLEWIENNVWANECKKNTTWGKIKGYFRNLFSSS